MDRERNERNGRQDGGGHGVARHSTQQRNTILVSVVTAFITTFMGSALNLSIPAIETEFGVSAQTVGWTITIYMLTCAALAVPFGRLADMVDRRTILWIGILIFTSASAGAVFVGKMWSLLFFRFLQGVGAAMIFSTNIAILVGAFDGKERGRVIGYSTSATYVGLSAGPVLGGMLNFHFGWRSVFIATAAVAAVALYSALHKLPKEKQADGFTVKPKFDLQGSTLYIAGITALMYGLSVVTTTVYGVWILLGGVVLLIFFGRTELHAEEPVVALKLFRHNLPYTFSNLAAMFNYSANFAISYLLSIYLQVVMGYSSQAAGMVLITGPVVQAVLSPLAGRLSDRYSPYMLSSLGMALCAASLIFYTFLPQDASLAMILCALCVTGVGFALFASPNTNAIMALVKKEDYSVASSLLATMRSIGHTASMAIVTVVVGIYLQKGSLAEAAPNVLMQTMHTAFFVFTILCILGIFMAMKRKV